MMVRSSMHYSLACMMAILARASTIANGCIDERSEIDPQRDVPVFPPGTQIGRLRALRSLAQIGPAAVPIREGRMI